MKNYNDLTKKEQEKMLECIALMFPCFHDNFRTHEKLVKRNPPLYFDNNIWKIIIDEVTKLPVFY
jgi:hypothetical protein